MHKTPTQQELAACEVWLLKELREVQPQVMMALGATAYRSLTHQTRGDTGARTSTTLERDGVPRVVTYHPSAALRVPTIKLRRAIFEELVSGLKRAAQLASATHDGCRATLPHAACPAAQPGSGQQECGKSAGKKRRGVSAPDVG